MNTDVQAEILKYLQENKSANTFKLARSLGIDRSKIVRELAKLHEKGLIEHRTGMARFLSKPKLGAVRPEKPEPVQKISKLKPKTERPRIKKQILPANIKLKLAEENKKLRAKLAQLKNNFEQQAGMERRLKAQNTHVGRLEEEIKALQQQAPKVIRKIIVRHVPKIIVRRIVERIPKVIVKRIPVKEGVEAGKPAAGPSWLSNLSKLGQNIGQLSIPEVFNKKVELKRTHLDFVKLKDSISSLEIPDMLKKGW